MEIRIKIAIRMYPCLFQTEILWFSLSRNPQDRLDQNVMLKKSLFIRAATVRERSSPKS